MTKVYDFNGSTDILRTEYVAELNAKSTQKWCLMSKLYNKEWILAKVPLTCAAEKDNW